jgi:hypothetical protein
MTKCTFHKFGGSGTIQKFDALCVLGMNIINEKVSILVVVVTIVQKGGKRKVVTF